MWSSMAVLPWVGSAAIWLVLAPWTLRAESFAILDEQRAEHGNGVQRIALSPDGKLLASASPTMIRLWDLEGPMPRERAKIAGLKNVRTGGVRSMVFLPDGKTLAVGVGGNTLRLLDISGGALVERLALEDQNGNVQSLAVSPDGKTLAAGSDDMTVLFYDITGAQPKERFRVKVQKANFGVKTLHFTPDGKRLVLSTGSCNVRLWNLETTPPQELADQRLHGADFRVLTALSPDGRHLAVTDDQNITLHLWQVTEEKFVPVQSWPKVHRKPMAGISWAPKGPYVATADKDGRFIVWNMDTKEKVLDLQKSGHFENALLSAGPQPNTWRLTLANWTSKGQIHRYTLGENTTK